jgi:hypothetical protein
MDILDGFYCKDTLWKAYPDLEGPSLLQNAESSAIVKTLDAELPFINADEFDLPAWIVASKEVGPRHYSSPKYWITFSINSMPR